MAISAFKKKAPLEASSLTRFRERLGEEGAEELLKQTIEVAKRAGLLKKSALKEVIVDTTVQEKNISYPTDGKLINKAREHLVDEAKREDISLRQSYKIKGKKEKAQSVVPGKAKDKGMKRFLKRRSSIEPVIGHMKQEHRLGRNYFGGIEGDRFNPILAASAFNMQKCVNPLNMDKIDYLDAS